MDQCNAVISQLNPIRDFLFDVRKTRFNISFRVVMAVGIKVTESCGIQCRSVRRGADVSEEPMSSICKVTAAQVQLPTCFSWFRV